jgi:type I restriction enzyme S subunit
VAEIEKQFTRLEAGVAALRRVQANLKRYRAAVLKAACEGRLVPTEAELAKTGNRKAKFETGEALLARILTERRQKWQGRGQYKEPVAPDTANLPALPEGWTWATTQQLNLANRPCAYGVLQPGESIPDGVLFVRVGDINNGKVDLTNLKRISVTIAAQYPRTKLHGGELAITLVGAIGRTAIIPDSLAGGNTARAVGIIPLTKQVNAHWVEIWFRNPAKNAEMDSKSHEVARKTLNLEDVRGASVALPPLAEQTRILAEVERRLSVAEELEAVVSANLQRATRLRQSILQKAFMGELS